MAPGLQQGAVQFACQGRVEDLVDQGGLACPGDAGDRHQQPQRDVHGEVVQVVFGGVEQW
jgi:hypothetical protein